MVFPALVFALFTVALVTCNELESRVYNGQEIGSDEFKFLVELKLTYSNETLTCSGSILNTRWIVTAAHCVSHQGKITEIKVTRLGNSPAVPPLAINSYKRHPDYVPTGNAETVAFEYIHADIALLQTKEPIMFNERVQPIPLGRELAQGLGVIAGYGQPENQPRKGFVLLSYCPYSNKQILCTYRDSNMSRTGNGDSGGPVVANGVLVGVVSGEVASKYGKHINFFADIHSKLYWIQTVIQSL